jgi:glyoxylate reductase
MVANCALYLILDAYRYFHFADHCIRINEYVESRSIARMAEDPSGHILAIIGLGNIGLAIAQRAEALGMKIHYYTPKRKTKSESTLRTAPVYHDSLDSIFAVADCICLACPYTRETHHMLGPRAFSIMKKGVRIVNIARGKLIDEEALLSAMDEGRVVGLGVDVHEHEPDVNPKLKENYMTTLLPHIGVCSKTSWRNFETNCIKNLEAYFYGDDGVPITPVNKIPLTRRVKYDNV